MKFFGNVMCEFTHGIFCAILNMFFNEDSLKKFLYSIIKKQLTIRYKYTSILIRKTNISSPKEI